MSWIRSPWPVVAFVLTFLSGHTAQAQTLLSQGRPVLASSQETVDTVPAYAVDGNTATRWSSAFSDPQWIRLDLGGAATITRVLLNWETAAGKSYQIQTSTDAVNWANVFSTTTGDGGVDDLTVGGSGRYVRMYGTARTTGYGYSLWELQVYGTTGSATPTATATTPPRATATATPTTPPTGSLLSQGRAVVVSSTENAGTGGNLAVDGNTGTRWSSAYSDPQWIRVDLGSTATISRVLLNWEAAYGQSYQIQTSGDGATWTTIYSTTSGNGAIDDLTGLSGSGRYVRMYGTVRATGYGYSLWELQVYGTGGAATPTATARPRATATATAPPRATATASSNSFRDDFNTFDSNTWACEYTCPTVSSGVAQFTLQPNVAPNNVGSWSKIRYKPRTFTSGSFTIRYALNRRPTQAVWWGEALWDDGPAADQFNEINFGYTTSQSFTNSQLFFESARLGNDAATKVDLGVDLYNGTYHIGKLVYDSSRVEFWFDGVLRASVTNTANIATDPMSFIIGPRLVTTPNLTSAFIMSVDYTEVAW